MINNLNSYLIIFLFIVIVVLLFTGVLLLHERDKARNQIIELQLSIQEQNNAVQKWKNEAASQTALLINKEKMSKKIEKQSMIAAKQILEQGVGTTCQDAIHFGIQEAKELKES